MDASAKRRIGADGAKGVEDLAIRPNGVIARCRGQQTSDLRVRGERHATNLDRVVDMSGEEVEWRVEPEAFFDCACDRFGLESFCPSFIPE